MLAYKNRASLTVVRFFFQYPSAMSLSSASLTRRASLGLMLGALAGCTPKPRTQGQAKVETPQKLRYDLRKWPSLDAMAQGMIDAKKTPGLSLSVLRNGVMLYSKGFGLGDISTRAPATAQSGFRVASVTKQFTAAAILLLAEQGALTVTDPLSRFLPDYPRGADMTLGQMMSHTAGLGDYINSQDGNILEEAQTRDYTTDELLQIIQSSTIQRFQPGTRYAYSNSGFALLGIVAERVSGMPYADFIAKNLFAPAGMTGSGIDALASVRPDCCGGYRPNHLPGAGFGPVYPVSPSFIGGAGAIRSSTEDLVRWHHALLNGHVLKPESVMAMLRPGKLDTGAYILAEHEGYGYGQRLGMEYGQPYFMHGGMVNGFASHLRSYPVDRVTVACLYNCDGVGGGGFWLAQHDLRIEASRLALTSA